MRRSFYIFIAAACLSSISVVAAAPTIGHGDDQGQSAATSARPAGRYRLRNQRREHSTRSPERGRSASPPPQMDLNDKEDIYVDPRGNVFVDGVFQDFSGFRVNSGGGSGSASSVRRPSQASRRRRRPPQLQPQDTSHDTVSYPFPNSHSTPRPWEQCSPCNCHECEPRYPFSSFYPAPRPGEQNQTCPPCECPDCKPSFTAQPAGRRRRSPPGSRDLGRRRRSRQPSGQRREGNFNDRPSLPQNQDSDSVGRVHIRRQPDETDAQSSLLNAIDVVLQQNGGRLGPRDLGLLSGVDGLKNLDLGNYPDVLQQFYGADLGAKWQSE